VVPDSPHHDRLTRRSLGTPLAITIVLVSLLEFVLLVGMHNRGDALEDQRRAQAGFAAVLDLLTDNSSRPSEVDGERLLRATRTHLDTLDELGVGDSELVDLAAVEVRLDIDASDPAAAADVRQARAELDAVLAARSEAQDTQAVWFFVGLLVVASVGWYVYFVRFLRRHRAAQQRLTSARSEHVNEKRLLALVQNSADVVLLLDESARATFVSPSSRRVLGHEPAELLGRPVLALVNPGDAERLVALLASQSSGATDPIEMRMQHADGRELVTEGTLTDLTGDEAVHGHVLTVRDVTERHALAEQLTKQAFFDDLTGLANRQLFHDRLSHALQPRPGSVPSHMLLFCDLDDFKHVNDSLGHSHGDRLLAEVGARISATVRPGDTAARLGGDEFAILMENAGPDAARTCAEELLRVLAEPLVLDGVSSTVHASIGLAGAVAGQVTPEDAMRNADVAMYWAKDRGKSTIASYDKTLHAEALDRLSLRSELDLALKSDQLVLHFQPTVDLQTGALSGFEALVRWQHPERGLLPPGRFVPMAEQTGQILALGTWVLREACRAAAAMGDGPTAPGMAVNIAARQLADAGFVDEVLMTLAATGLDPTRLTLEITESVVLDEMGIVTLRLAALRARGVQIAIDDFGTGYSSLAYLSELPIDVIKIDKSFIDRVTHDMHTASVTEAVIQVSRKLGISTVAEGVEQPSQLSWLRRMQCTTGQGFLWSRPVPFAEAVELLPDEPSVRDGHASLVTDGGGTHRAGR
jgi:diguanylate cyclase (GGDEF)-like protein/PAS domain S-box-containing protein